MKHVYTIFNRNDGIILQSESLHAVLAAILVDLSFGHKLSKMTMYISGNDCTLINQVVMQGKILDLGEYLAAYQIFISLIRGCAKTKNPKNDLMFLKKKFKQYYL